MVEGWVNLAHFTKITYIPHIQTVIVVDAGQPAVRGVIGHGHRVRIADVFLVGEEVAVETSWWIRGTVKTAVLQGHKRSSWKCHEKIFSKLNPHLDHCYLLPIIKRQTECILGVWCVCWNAWVSFLMVHLFTIKVIVYTHVNEGRISFVKWPMQTRSAFPSRTLTNHALYLQTNKIKEKKIKM